MNKSLIVCPAEFSPSGESAVKYALALALAQDAHLHVVHVLGQRRALFNGPAEKQGETATQARLRKFVESAASGRPDFQGVLLAGDPLTAVVEYATRHGADVIVVGQHGRQGSPYWRRGVFAVELSRSVGCRILTVPDEIRSGDVQPVRWGHILCAVDFSEGSAPAVDEAISFGRESSSLLTLVHVVPAFPYETVDGGGEPSRPLRDYQVEVESAEARLRSLGSLARNHFRDVVYRTVPGEPKNAILTLAREIGADLVIVGVSDRSFDRVLMESTSSVVVRHSPCPVLAVPRRPNFTKGNASIGSQRDVAHECWNAVVADVSLLKTPYASPH